MHGRKRADREELDAPEVRAAKAEKYRQYLMGCKLALSSDESAQKAEKLLRYNPDFLTLWNSRRRYILSELGSEKHPDKQALKSTLLAQELALTKDQIAERNSKSYGAWFQRRWAIETLGNHEGKNICDYGLELELCDALLMRDERNFHCWAHRAFVSELAGIPPRADLEKSDALIGKNFSNYSAWHLRVQAIKRLGSAFDEWAKEFELVHQAIFTEPADQSAWLYLRWLLMQKGALSDENRLQEELDTIQSLLEEDGDCKWPVLAKVEVLSLMPLTPERRKVALEACDTLKRLDIGHINFYVQVASMFEVGSSERLRKLLFLDAHATT